MLVFDATKEVGYKGPGAHHAEIRKEPPRGLALYPIVFSHPWEDPEELKPSLISAITENNLDLKTCNKVVYSYDQRVCNAFIKLLLKFIHSEKATKFCEIPTNYLTGSTYIGQIIGGDFAKFCGLLRIYELYQAMLKV